MPEATAVVPTIGCGISPEQIVGLTVVNPAGIGMLFSNKVKVSVTVHPPGLVTDTVTK